MLPLTELVKVTGIVSAPLQTVWPDTGVTAGEGLTVIVNACGVPGQPAAAGVTVRFATTGEVPLFIAVKESIFPVPLAARPMLVLSFVQVKVVLSTVPVKSIGPSVVLLHTVLLPGLATVGVGFTVMVKDDGAPVHPFATGVTVMVSIKGAAVPLAPANEGMLSIPVAAVPIPGLLFVKLKVVLSGVPVKMTAVVIIVLHTA